MVEAVTDLRDAPIPTEGYATPTHGYERTTALQASSQNAEAVAALNSRVCSEAKCAARSVPAEGYATPHPRLRENHRSPSFNPKHRRRDSPNSRVSSGAKGAAGSPHPGLPEAPPPDPSAG